MMNRCPICNRISEDADNGFCRYHLEAKKNLATSYEKWKRALDISWEEYLDRVIELDGTGSWVKEIVEVLRTKDASSGT
ncbi:MAG: hypothetical protein K9W43_00275 [Candidatus Thorarchaeota archaeon]|nr:hypothetical protein [Candidatus Thorarchaeota archaeon]